MSNSSLRYVKNDFLDFFVLQLMFYRGNRFQNYPLLSPPPSPPPLLRAEISGNVSPLQAHVARLEFYEIAVSGVESIILGCPEIGKP